jgi:ABC-type Fe3+ transport system substrate-binding protein
VGPLPQELQKITFSSAGLFAGSKEPAAARAFLDFLFTTGIEAGREADGA